MSIVLRHRYIVRDVFAVPFQTKHGLGLHYFSRDSVLYVNQTVPIAGLKRFRYPQKVSSFKPSNTKKPKSEPEFDDEKPASKPEADEKPKSKPEVDEKPIQDELFSGSVTLNAAPSPRHTPIPMFLRPIEDLR